MFKIWGLHACWQLKRVHVLALFPCIAQSPIYRTDAILKSSHLLQRRLPYPGFTIFYSWTRKRKYLQYCSWNQFYCSQIGEGGTSFLSTLRGRNQKFKGDKIAQRNSISMAPPYAFFCLSAAGRKDLTNKLTYICCLN